MAIVFGGSLPDLDEGPVTECSRPGKTICSTKKDVSKMQQFLVNSGVKQIPQDSETIVKLMLTILNLHKESEIYESAAYQKFTGPNLARQSLFENFLGTGPANSTDLLNDSNIDGALARWARISQEEFGKKFYHVPFQMIDFLENGTELAKLDLIALKHDGYDSFGVVLNTDVSTGGGIHWFCLYGDLSGNARINPDNKANKANNNDKRPITLEYFNSSGFKPKSSVTYWLQNAQTAFHNAGYECEIIEATGGKQVQNSKTECGVWSLAYIFSRITDHPPNWVVNVSGGIDPDDNANEAGADGADADMVSFRKRLFRS